jgi:DNA-directed RNA polymerase specialized sigma24 family protein
MSETRFQSLPPTRWSLIARAAGDDQEALIELLKLYIPALGAHLRFARRVDPDEAEDILQSFLLEKVLEKPLLASARRERGRFRSFVLRALDNFLIDWRRRRQRRFESQALALEEGSEDEAAGEPSELAETAWAAEVVREALRRTEAYCLEAGHETCWKLFDARLLAPALRDEKPRPYGEVVGALGIASPREAANKLTTAKRIFIRCLRQVVEGYVKGPLDEVDGEILELKRILEGAKAWPAEEERGSA